MWGWVTKRIGVVTGVVVAFALVAQTAQAASWTVESTPNPSGATSSQLNGLSCAPATACTPSGPTPTARARS